MKLVWLAMVSALAVSGQSLPEWTSTVPGTFEWTKIQLPKIDIHMVHANCKGQPDSVYSRSGNVYYACIGGVEVCSNENTPIPANLKAAYDARAAEFQQRAKEYRAKLVREGRAVSEDPQENLKYQVARHRALVAAVQQARAAGQQPRAVAPQPAVAAPTGTVEAATASAAPPPTVTEEQVRAIAIGTARADVIKGLGQPSSRISGGIDRFTYVLTNGQTAKLQFEDGKVSQVSVSGAQ